LWHENAESWRVFLRRFGLLRQEQQLFTFGFFLDNSPQEIMTPLARHGWLGTGKTYIKLFHFYRDFSHQHHGFNM